MNADFFKARPIAVIGAGPVGAALAACLSSSGHEVVLCDFYKNLIDKAITDGITIEGDLNLNAKVAHVTDSVDNLKDFNPSAIFIAAKATSLNLIASSIHGFHQPGMCVVSWQNGIDTERILAENISPGWVMRAVVNFGVTLTAPLRVRMDFHNPPHWLMELGGEGRESAKALAELLTASGLPTRHTDKLVDYVWRKSILNSALSPLCAITKKSMAEVLHDPYLFEMADALLKEGIRIARANEIGLGWDFYRFSLDYLEKAGDHKPSMLTDIEKGRRTEIDHINGRLIEYAKMVDVPSPCNQMMRALVKAVEPR